MTRWRHREFLAPDGSDVLAIAQRTIRAQRRRRWRCFVVSSLGLLSAVLVAYGVILWALIFAS